MYIKANIDDCALIINEFLPDELFKKIKNYDYKLDKKNASYSHWDEYLFKDDKQNTTMEEVKISNVVSVIEKGEIQTDENIFKEFSQILIDCPFIPYQTNSSIHINYYEYDKFSGINWHDDGSYTLNYSFYINDDWDENWGGETLINTGRGLPLVSYPYSNSLLAIKNGVAHKVCPVTGPKKRRALQIRGIFYE